MATSCPPSRSRTAASSRPSRAPSCPRASCATARSSTRTRSARSSRRSSGPARCRKDVRLGVANQQIVVRQLELPRIEEDKDLEAAVRFQASRGDRDAARTRSSSTSSASATASTPTATRGRSVVVVAARESMIERLVEAVRVGGPAAGRHRPERLRARARARVRRPRRLRARVLPSRRDHEPRDRRRLELPVHAPAGHPRRRRPASSTRFALAEEIRLSIDFYLAQPETRPVREIVLSGPRAPARRARRAAAAATGLEVVAAEPLGMLRPRVAARRRGPAPPHRRARALPGGGRREARQPSSRALPAAHRRVGRLEDRLHRARRRSRSSCSPSSATS